MHSLNRGLEFALLLTLPATVALIVIAGPVIAGLFQHGRFGADDAAATAAALTAFAWGLPAYVLVKILQPAFYAREDTVRSEEHTSELQSLMRISSAVFCLKKKK